MNHPDLNGHTCVIRTSSGEILTSDEHGILPPLRWLREDKATLKNADVSDKVIGRAAALLFACGGVRSIWAETMSDTAIEFLRTTDILFEYLNKVEFILNRGGTGMCPMERRALGIDDPARAFALFDEVIP